MKRAFLIIAVLMLLPVNKNIFAFGTSNPDNYAASLDSMMNLWHSRPSVGELVVDTIIESAENLVEELPDSVYIARLAAINTPIQLTFNSQVKSYIKLYTQRRREQVEQMLGLSQYYFPIFEAELDAANLPHELKYLPVIESALNPRALSKAGASGIWQFMYYTGKRYGLEVNSYIDERRDPVKASKAAVAFLSDLYEIYGDWKLVIAAYNCGPGNVNKAIRRTGGKTDFWEIYYRLPRETRGYVPAYIAAVYTFNYSREHGLYPKAPQLPVATDTVMVYQPLHFKQISEITSIPLEVIRDLNPQYRLDVIPAKDKMYPLRLAFDHATLFASLEDTIYNHRRLELFPDNKLVAAPVEASSLPVVAPAGTEAIYYTVKSGDVVGLIADWFDVRTSDLQYWNNIKRNMIRVGQKLVIYVPKAKADHYRAVAQRHGSSAASVKPATTASAQSTSTLASSASASGEYVYYTVRSGDNIWAIAKKYQGVSPQDILNLNNISDATKIKPGQKLKIKPL